MCSAAATKLAVPLLLAAAGAGCGATQENAGAGGDAAPAETVDERADELTAGAINEDIDTPLAMADSLLAAPTPRPAHDFWEKTLAVLGVGGVGSWTVQDLYYPWADPGGVRSASSGPALLPGRRGFCTLDVDADGVGIACSFGPVLASGSRAGGETWHDLGFRIHPIGDAPAEELEAAARQVGASAVRLSTEGGERLLAAIGDAAVVEVSLPMADGDVRTGWSMAGAAPAINAVRKRP